MTNREPGQVHASGQKPQSPQNAEWQSPGRRASQNARKSVERNSCDVKASDVAAQNPPVRHNRDRHAKGRIAIEALSICATPAILVACALTSTDQTTLLSLVVVLASLGVFFGTYESSAPRLRDIMPTVVLAALAAAGRILFAPIPDFKPVSAIAIIAGVVFGRKSGFMVGALAALASNFFFGQGPWTPWQMYAWGLVGYGAGLLAAIPVRASNRASESGLAECGEDRSPRKQSLIERHAVIIYIWIRFLPYVRLHPERMEHPRLLSRASKRPRRGPVGLRNCLAIRCGSWHSNGCVLGNAICAMASQTETNQKQVWNGIGKHY